MALRLMNENDRAELDRLKRQQEMLERELSALAMGIQRLELRVTVPESNPAEVPGQEQVSPAPIAPHAVPPPLPAMTPVASTPLPSTALPKPAAIHVVHQTELDHESAPPAPEEASLEMRLGTYWFVRVGVGMLLAGLALFASYAYQNFIWKLGPGGRLVLLYLASGVMLGAGAFWQRKAVKESLRNYGQVLFAGGLAAVYFTTYAAHHFEAMRVINSGLVDGVLLFAWASFMVWIAERKKSELLALFAILLAYYAAVITRVGTFTLYSNLVLTAAAVFFLVRNRWARVSFAGLIACYSTYFCWRFFDATQWTWTGGHPELWTGASFLLGYWVLFTAAVFLSTHEKLSGPTRALYLSLNNGAFFAMFLLTMVQSHVSSLWKFELGFGSALLVLAALAHRFLARENLSKNSYLTQGLLLVTLGFVSKFTGTQLALVLSAESVALFLLGTALRNPIMETGACLSGAMSLGWGIDALEHFDTRTLWSGVTIGALMLVNAVRANSRTAETDPRPIRPLPLFFTVLALGMWGAATWYNTSAENFPLALAIEAIALTATIYFLPLREMPFVAQAYIIVAQALWLLRWSLPSSPHPAWWNPALIILLTLALGHWWQHQKRVVCAAEWRWFCQGLYAAAVVGVLYFWLQPLSTPPSWLVWTSALAAGLTVYGVASRAWLVALFGQAFLAVSVWQFGFQLANAKPEWGWPIAPIVVLCALSIGTALWFARKPENGQSVRAPLSTTAVIYRWTGLAMSLWWTHEYIADREQIWVLALAGVILFALSGWRCNSEALAAAAVFGFAGFGLFWAAPGEIRTVYVPDLLAILALLAAQRAAKQFPQHYVIHPHAHGAMMIAGGVSLWIYLTRFVLLRESGFYLTASWAALALALFAAGMAVRERVYRWVGLAVLTCALGRVFVFDVWTLETPYRILSFMALGIVLLVLAYIYTRFQEKIRQWL